MQIKNAIDITFEQLRSLLVVLPPEIYTAMPEQLSGASIGQHFRHILEIFVCLNEGYETGVINYENRKRNRELEQNKAMALVLINALNVQLEKVDCELKLRANYDLEISDQEIYSTTYGRELVYALEHAVHHMALIKIAIKILKPELTLPADFGVAVSTIKYRRACAQ